MPAFVPAGSETTTLPTVVQLFAGEAPITTNRAQGGVNLQFAQYEVIALVGGLIVKWNPAGSDGSQNIAGILATPLDTRTTGGTPGSWAPYYTGGDFNHAALVWPAGTAYDTFAERKAAFDPLKTIKISTVL